jgi:hypothetical protein
LGTESFSSTPKQTRARQIDFCLYFEPSTAEFCTGGAKECAALKQEEACLVFEPSTAEFCAGGAKECAPLKRVALFGLRAQYCRVLYWRCKRVRSPQSREALFGLRAQYCSVLCWRCKRVRCPQTRGSPVWSSSPVLQSSVLAMQKSALPSNKRKPCLVFVLSAAELCTASTGVHLPLKQEKVAAYFLYS